MTASRHAPLDGRYRGRTVFYAVDPSPNHWALGESLVWEHNLRGTLEAMGFRVVPFRYDFRDYNRNLDAGVPEQRAYVEAHRASLEESLLRQLRRAHAERPIDLFFSYFYSAHCRPEVIREIASLGIPTVNFFCNASYQFDLVREIAPAFDWCLVPERFRLDDYRAAGASPYYFQEAANPAFYHPHPCLPRHDAVFVGQMYGDRPFLIDHLHRAGVDVRVWGPGWRDAYPSGARLWSGRVKRLLRGEWPRVRRRAPATATPAAAAGIDHRYPRLPARILGAPLSDAEMVRSYSLARVVLGFSKCGDTYLDPAPIRQVRLRDFEVPMSGAFYLMEHVPEIEEFFEVGREVVSFRSAEELADKARYYLAHESEREAIRRAGHRRALGEHTWAHRFERFFQHSGVVCDAGAAAR